MQVDDEAKAKALQITFDSVMGILSDEAKTFLSEAVKDLKVYITTKIEAKIKDSKE